MFLDTDFINYAISLSAIYANLFRIAINIVTYTRMFITYSSQIGMN